MKWVQLTFNKATAAAGSLDNLRRGEHAVLETLDVPEELGRRLMELGFFPGGIITAAGCAPGGDPRIFRVDGSEVALRVETARRMRIRPLHPDGAPPDQS